MEAPVGKLKIKAEEFYELAIGGVPFVGQLAWRIERFEAGAITTRLPYQDLILRPGGTICGPALMALADVTLYGLVLSMIGRVELAVTTDMHVRFLAKPQRKDVLAEGRIIRLGRRLAVGEVEMRTDGDPRLICHATGAYAIPAEPRRSHGR